MSREGGRGLGALVRLTSTRPVFTVSLSVVFALAALAYTFRAGPTLARLLDGIRTEIVTAFVRSAFDLGLDGDDKKVDLGAARDVLDQISTRLDRPAPFRSPWGSLFSLAPRDQDAGDFLS